jgi:hypothetical protein
MALDGGGGRVLDDEAVGADEGAESAARSVDGVRWCGSESRISRVDGGASGSPATVVGVGAGGGLASGVQGRQQ